MIGVVALDSKRGLFTALVLTNSILGLRVLVPDCPSLSTK